MNKTVLVTGGTRGIGFAIAKRFLEQEHNVAISFKSDEKKSMESLK